ncbi:DUF4142 domain-containing protein [Lysobacter sp. HA18]
MTTLGYKKAITVALTLALGACATTGSDNGTTGSSGTSGGMAASWSPQSTTSGGTSGTSGSGSSNSTAASTGVSTAGNGGTSAWNDTGSSSTGTSSGTSSGSNTSMSDRYSGTQLDTGDTGDMGGSSSTGQSTGSGTSGRNTTTGASSTSTGGSTTSSTRATSSSGRSASSGASSTTGTGSASASTSAGAAPVAHSQAEALAMVAAVDDHEIRAARQAISKNVSGGARQYADMMIAEHTPHLAATRKLMGGTSGSGTSLQQLTTMARQGEQQLASLSGQAYARAYIERMVMDHQMALQMLDASMGVVRDAAVRTHLTATRATVQKHLDHARQLQTQLGTG